MDITEACGFHNAVGNSTSYLFVPKQPQTRLKITVSHELKLLNIRVVYAILCITLMPGQVLNYRISIVKQWWSISELWETETPQHVAYLVAMCSSAKTYPATVIMAILGEITVYAWLLSSEGCDSFPKHLNLSPAPNKTNEVVEKQWNSQ